MLYQYEKFCHASQLNEEINNSSIIKELNSIQTEGSFTSIVFLSELSVEEKSILDALVQNHSPIYREIPLINQSVEIKNTEIDEQGRQITRIAAGQKGWVYFAHPIEFETSQLNSLYEKTSAEAARNICTLKFYDVNNVELTTQQDIDSSCVKTRILFKPQYDYELIAGSLQQIEAPASDVRIWVLGGIVDLGGPYVKEFAGGINMRFYGSNEAVKTDGRAAKYMAKDIAGVPFQANQLEVVVRHSVGFKHKLLLMLEYFRA